MHEPDSLQQKTYLGPKTVRADQLKDAVSLANRVFRSTGGGDMGRQYPMIFDPARLEQLRIFEHGGKPVSLVSTVVSDTVLLGCAVRVAAVGSVCTDAAHRGRNLAGRLVDDAVARALAAGAPIMLISGGRSLYTRRGAAGCGRFYRYDLRRDTLPPLDQRLTLREVTADNAESALRMYEAEALRFR